MSGDNTAEYQTTLRCGARIKLAVQSNLVSISDSMVANGLITPDNGQDLRNRHHSEADRASRFLKLLQSKVKDDAGSYRVFVNKILGENRFFYHGIIDYLNSEYVKIKDELSHLTANLPEGAAGIEQEFEGRIQSDSTDVVDPPKETEIPMYDESEAEIDVDPVPQGRELEELQTHAKETRIILHTVNDKETTAVLHVMKPLDGLKKLVNFGSAPFKIVLGIFGGYKAAQVKTKMGTDCSNGIKAALKRLPNICAVIAVGVGYGMDREKYKYGDVLVSKHVHGVKDVRLQPGEIRFRDSDISTVEVSEALTDIFTVMISTWNKKFQCNKTEPAADGSTPEARYAKVYCGGIICGPMLVADAKQRDSLRRNHPEVIGGEMEGGELVKIQNEYNADRDRPHDLNVIVIKGVGDFGDHRKEVGRKWQYTASLAAASYAEHKLLITEGTCSLFKADSD